MKVLIVYDSTHGNTERVALKIGEVIGGTVLRVIEANPADLVGVDLLIIGSPTHGGFHTKGIDVLLKALPSLKGTNVAAFDTRTRKTLFGYAAPKISQSPKKKMGICEFRRKVFLFQASRVRSSMVNLNVLPTG